jgi:hypothetical protein
VDISRTWESIREQMWTSLKKVVGYFELKQHKLWFYELIDHRNVKFQWLLKLNKVIG